MKGPFLYMLGLVVLAIALGVVAACVMTSHTTSDAPVQAAQSASIPSTASCTAEVAQVIAWIKERGTDANDIKSRFDADIADIKSVPKEVRVSEFNLKSADYHIDLEHTHKDGIEVTQDVLRGTALIEVIPANQAASIAEVLTNRGYKASVDGSSASILSSDDCKKLNVTN